MATKLTAARQLTLHAAERYDDGERADMEAGMAKLFASEVAMEIALNAVRIHGGYGYSTEYDVERYFRDAPLMIVGEGTNEIQRNVIAGQLVARGGHLMTGSQRRRIRRCANSFGPSSRPASIATARGYPPNRSWWRATGCPGRRCDGPSRIWWPRARCTGCPAAAPTPATISSWLHTGTCGSSDRSRT